MSVQEFDFAKSMERQDVPFRALIMAAMVQVTEMSDWDKLKTAWPEIAQECMSHQQQSQRQNDL